MGCADGRTDRVGGRMDVWADGRTDRQAGGWMRQADGRTDGTPIAAAWG